MDLIRTPHPDKGLMIHGSRELLLVGALLSSRTRPMVFRRTGSGRKEQITGGIGLLDHWPFLLPDVLQSCT
jgi:hypothetical protein